MMLRFRRQISPVRRTYPVKPLFTFGCDPPVVSEATWNVAIKRHSVYRLPFHKIHNLRKAQQRH